jgi:hypothetical protein
VKNNKWLDSDWREASQFSNHTGIDFDPKYLPKRKDTGINSGWREGKISIIKTEQSIVIKEPGLSGKTVESLGEV